MGLDSRKQQFDPNCLPSVDEVEEYTDQGEEECCDSLDFKPDLSKSAKSDWNQSVVRVFVAHYLQSDNCVERNEDRVFEHAEKHLTYLHYKFKKQCKTPRFKKELARRKARQERKRTVRILRISLDMTLTFAF